MHNTQALLAALSSRSLMITLDFVTSIYHRLLLPFRR